MKVFDLLGNVLSKDDVVFFNTVQGLVKILAIQEPGVLENNDVPGCLIVELRIPFKPEKRGQDVRFGDLMAVRNPAEASKVETQIADIMSGKTKPSHTLQMPSKRHKESQSQGA